MKSEKELFNLAKSYVMLESELDKPLREYEIEEVKSSLEEIRNTLQKLNKISDWNSPKAKELINALMISLG